MFFGEARREKMVRVILASEDEERQTALDELLPLQQDDLEDIFEAMDGLPVTIRLLEPPLHEFLPKLHDIEQQVERARIERSDDLDRLTRTCDRVRALQEVNPMLGTRGARLGLLHPEIYEMQVHAIFRAVLAARRHGVAVHTEILVPLVSYRRELELLLGLIRRAADTHGLRRGADFFSFGTNDLTQTALGFSRDDIESRILSRYIESTVFDRSPFETLDASGVGQLVRMGAWLGRKTNRSLKLGVCGEHAGDPDSIDFFHHSGIDYVSCSPFRVPVARVAAAQAAVREKAAEPGGGSAI